MKKYLSMSSAAVLIGALRVKLNFQTTASTFDKRKMPLVFKACLMEMGENLLLDFRLSKVLK